MEEDAGALVGVASGAGEALEEDAGGLVGVASGAGGAVDVDAGALVGVASGAGEAVEEDAGALVGVAAEGAMEPDPGAVDAEEEEEVALAEKALGLWMLKKMMKWLWQRRLWGLRLLKTKK